MMMAQIYSASSSRSFPKGSQFIMLSRDNIIAQSHHDKTAISAYQVGKPGVIKPLLPVPVDLLHQHEAPTVPFLSTLIINVISFSTSQILPVKGQYFKTLLLFLISCYYSIKLPNIPLALLFVSKTLHVAKHRFVFELILQI